MANPTKTNGKSEKRVALEAMLAVESECKAQLEKLEAQADKLREKRNGAVLGWLEVYGVKGTTKDADGNPSVTYTHAPVRVDGIDIQPIYKRSKGGKPIAFVKRPGASEELA